VPPAAPAAPQSMVGVGSQVNGGSAGVAGAAAAAAMGVGLGIALSPIPSSNEEAFHAVCFPFLFLF